MEAALRTIKPILRFKWNQGRFPFAPFLGEKAKTMAWGANVGRVFGSDLELNELYRTRLTL